MKILVTGGCGFVGAAVCRRFIQARAGLALTVLDSMRRRGSETNVADLEGRGVRVVHGDVRVAADFDGLGPFEVQLGQASGATPTEREARAGARP